VRRYAYGNFGNGTNIRLSVDQLRQNEPRRTGNHLRIGRSWRS